MSKDSLYNLKYPIGTYVPPEIILGTHVEEWIDQISTLPERLLMTVEGITEKQLDTVQKST